MERGKRFEKHLNLKKGSSWFVGLVVVICVTSIVWIGIFSVNISEVTAGRISKIFIEELTDHTVLHFQLLLDDHVMHLRMLREMIVEDAPHSLDGVKYELQRMQEYYQVPVLGIVTADGSVYSSEGQIKEKVNQTFIQEVLLGEGRQLVFDTEMFQQDMILVGIPVAHFQVGDTEVVGMFLGQRPEDISDEFDLEHKNNNTYVSVVKADGNYIINNANENVYASGDNLLEQMAVDTDFTKKMSVEQLKDSFLHGERGFVGLSAKGNQQNVYYAPIPGTDWVVVSVVSYSSVSAQVKKLCIKMMVGAAITSLIIISAIGISMRFYTVSMRRKELELLEANRKAEEANASKSAFLANMSHDIRTPLNAILGLTTLLRKHADRPEVVEDYIGKIENSGKHLQHLIDDVLDMSQIEAGKTILREEAFWLKESLEEVCAVIGQEIEKKNLHFSFSFQCENQPVYGDEVRIQQVLLNILTNAIKYTDDGGKIEFEVTMTGKMEDSFLYRFRIADTGIGMAQEFVDEIFETFTREKNTVVAKTRGAGLGMAISKNLVDLMGGQISVESTPGKGSNFTVELPLKVVEAERIPAKRCKTENLFEGKRFLAAEDDEISRVILKELLEMTGAKVDVEADGKALIGRFLHADADAYDAIFLDIQMPIMDGYETARFLRESNHSKAKEIPIIAMTANAFAQDVEAVLAAGMDGHVSKPIDVYRIKRALDHLKV